MKNNHVLITGGNKGIGLETTKLLLHLKYKVTVIGRDSSTLEGLSCNFIPYDLRDIKNIATLISTIDDVDILINNAGIMNICGYENYSDTEKDDLLKINLEAPVELITCVSKSMIKNHFGRIVNNTSIAGQIGHPDIWYGISKAGLINATKSFAKILGSQGIIVNAVASSPVSTDMLQSIPSARKEAFLKNVYTGRFAEPIEVAKTMVWLATESPEYINGSCIDINDGSFQR
jgi:NAD(P)-dependent dehydrogenase (short-subunit alcohol dehydrogenase family)